MGFEQGLRDNGALLGTIGAAAALRNQRLQREELRKQNRILLEHAETEKQKLGYEQKRFELEQERVKSEKEDKERQRELERLQKKAIKEVRNALANSKTAIDRLEKEVQRF